MASAEQMIAAIQALATQTAQLQEFMARLATATTATAEATTNMASRGGEGREREGRPWDELSRFRNIKPFTGDSKEWEEFSTKLKGQIAASSDTAGNVFEHVESKVSEADLQVEGLEFEIGDQEVDAETVKVISQKMYNVLLNLTTGEANAVVRRCRGKNGLLAWKRLSNALNPRTLASGVKLISQALGPPKITDAKMADLGLDLWEDKLVRLQVEYGETSSEKVKVAVVYGMLPKDLQDRVIDKCAIT